MVCTICGNPETVEVEGLAICEECYYKAGSCCREFGADDLWKRCEEEGEACARKEEGVVREGRAE